jgi:hypothetical protein
MMFLIATVLRRNINGLCNGWQLQAELLPSDLLLTIWLCGRVIGKLIVAQSVNISFLIGIGNFTMFATWTYHEPPESSPHSANLFSICFNIVPPCTQLRDNTFVVKDYSYCTAHVGVLKSRRVRCSTQVSQVEPATWCMPRMA